ncbi:MAG: hypothetical protein UX58_C0004G0094 [Candidatus Wolfebacteria bacterium GW2011_GWB2_46_69]|nr:MAG: hypothetical protein UX58_C0004G0094 [Candidatus Wolfebacteria bacterium GW2011_GWB2_46_69]KKU54428.1 MAG: hypothetical protein UX76_C0002G0021 [Candidatus Wolfebacteria bacterium GW2011_GWC1_47_103]KKU59756.1 MAG: hypothetical protein UX83_C0002G0043 [Candidatus Wolfebacteria bacterium GW2011_GWE2_47_12]KKU65747.1 MAG: hypothetical protein UX90_C0002G0123 [Candidatus Wolfebacteria bacterium GW2011_GWD2_47_17]
MTGEGPEVIFKQEVARYEAMHGVSHEAAEKALFLDRFNALQHELTYNRAISDETHRAFVASLNEVFGKNGVADMKRDSATPIYRALLLSPASLAEFNQTANYFKTKFENKVPGVAVVKDCAENKKIIEALSTRFMGDPSLAGVGDLEALIAAHPELGADLGKILSAKELSDMHERRFEAGIRFNRSMETLGNTARESLGTMVWKAPSEWWKVVGKSGEKLNFEYCAKTTIATAKLLHKEGKAGTKLLVEAAKTAKAYIDKTRT